MKSFKEYYSELEANHYRLLKDVTSTFNEDSVHDFRVNIKKIRAFFALMQAMSSDFSSEKAYSAEYRPVYKKSGLIRDLQVQQSKFLMSGNSGELAFKNYIESIADEELKQKHRFALKFRKHEKVRNNQVERLWRSIDADEIIIQQLAIGYIAKSVFDIKECKIYESTTLEKYHDLRKKLKELQYNLNVIETCVFERKMFKTLTRRLKKFTEALGNWHDTFVFLAFVFSFKLNQVKISNRQISMLGKLEKELLLRQGSEINDILMKYEEFCSYSDRIVNFWKVKK